MKEYGTTEALKKLRQKTPSLSPVTLKKWIREGKVKGRTKKHGIFRKFLIPESEIIRLLAILPRKEIRIIGLSLLPKAK